MTSSKGPEAGVWVIAETTDFPIKFRKIVVTDDRGRYLLPELRNAHYKVWVRGYGLVDSQPVDAMPGKPLALTAVIAPDARAAAQYYPANYWYSLLKIPPKSAFPMKIPPAPPQDEDERFIDCRGNDVQCVAVSNSGKRPSPPHIGWVNLPDLRNGHEIENQAQYIFNIKRGCEDCHQMGNKPTREIPKSIGTFDSPSLAWERMLGPARWAARCWPMSTIISGMTPDWPCLRIGAAASPPEKCRRLRRGRRASNAMSCSRSGTLPRTAPSSMTWPPAIPTIPTPTPMDGSTAPTMPQGSWSGSIPWNTPRAR